MLDWNRNGEIDPVDVGISVGIDDAAADKPTNEKKSKRPIGCLASCLTIIVFAVSAILCVFSLII
jgi:hypothetical protein